MRSNPLHTLIQALQNSCVLAVIPASGTYQDWSPLGQTVAPSVSGVKWITGEQDGISAEGASSVIATDHVSLQITSGSLICGCPAPPTYYTFNRLFGKRFSAANGYDFFLNGTNSIALQGNVTSSFVSDWTRARTFGVCWANGGFPEFYYDGVNVGTGSSAITTAAGSGDLRLGNSAVIPRPMISPVSGWLIFDRPLAAVEVAQVHTFLTKLRTSRSAGADRRYFDRPTPPESSGGVVFDFDAANAVGRKVWDRAQNWDFGLGGNVVPQSSVLGPVLEGDGASGYAFNASTLKAFTGGFTLKARVLVLGSTGTTQAFVGFSSALYFDMLGSRTLRYFAAGLTPDSGISSGVLQYGAPYEVAMVHDPVAGKVYQYLNGVKVLDQPVTGTVTVSQIGVMNANANGFRFMRGQMSRAVMHDYPQSEEQITASWNELANRVLYYEDFWDVPDTLADITAGGIPGTDLIVGSGAWKVTRDATHAWLECVSSGFVYVPYNIAFGVWDFDLYKGGATQPTLSFVASTPTATSDSTHSGYYVLANASERLSIAEVVGGASTTKTASADSVVPENDWFSLRIDRRADGALSYYRVVNGVATLVDSSGAGTNPFTDLTHTTSQYMVFDLDSGDRISRIQHTFGAPL